MLLVNICLCLLALGLLWGYASMLLETMIYPKVTQWKWISVFSLALLKKKSYMLLNDWLHISSKGEVMGNIIDFRDMTKIAKYQHFTRRKLQEVENNYYPLIKDLTEKIIDLGEVDKKFIPDFDLYNFSFIVEWQTGLVNTAFVLDLLQHQNHQDVAEKQLTRRLTNFMHGKELKCPKTYDYVRDTRAILKVKAVPIYVAYLEMLTKLFAKMQEVDEKQVPVTWLEEKWYHRKDETPASCVREMSFNQVYRDLEANVLPNNKVKYFVGKNLLVFDEYIDEDLTLLHWIFLPESYATQFKKLFDITKELPVMDEKPYIQKIIGAHII